MSAELVVLMICTAVLSSVFTAAVVWALFQYLVKPRLETQVKPALEAQLETQLEVLRGKVRQGVEDAGVEMLPKLREQVRGGFEDAAKGLIPAFRAEVEESFKDILQATAGGDIVDRVTKTASILGSGLDMLRPPSSGPRK